MRVLILGVTGTLGHALWHVFREHHALDTWGTLRSEKGLSYFSEAAWDHLIHDVDVLDQDTLLSIFEKVRPDVVINAIGIIKQLAASHDPLAVLPINAMLPHRLARMCALANARLLLMSTDCVFSGKKGDYVESDRSDAEDLYGQSKAIGEVADLPHVLTMRSSIIGHELNSHYSLVDWFLAQTHSVKGYVNAIYSGFPTVEFAKIVRDYIVPNKGLSGVYHMASKPISKFDLLQLIAERYNKKIRIEPDEAICIDRSLCAKRFNDQTGFVPAEWPILIDRMYESRTLIGNRFHAD